jgi:hypothetical protein
LPYGGFQRLGRSGRSWRCRARKGCVVGRETPRGGILPEFVEIVSNKLEGRSSCGKRIALRRLIVGEGMASHEVRFVAA